MNFKNLAKKYEYGLIACFTALFALFILGFIVDTLEGKMKLEVLIGLPIMLVLFPLTAGFLFEKEIKKDLGELLKD